MNFFSWLLVFSALILMVLKGTEFHRSMVCRQEAWQISLDLVSHSLFSESKIRERTYHSPCQLILYRLKDRVTWQKVPSLNWKTFELGLRGSL